MHSAWRFHYKTGSIWFPNRCIKSYYYYDYLSNRKQRAKINEIFSCWNVIEYGVPQGPILGPLSFDIYLCDFFYFSEDLDIASYTDDTTIYKVKENKECVINILEASSLSLFTWLNNNFMKAKSGKVHRLLSCSEPSTTLIDGSFIESNTNVISVKMHVKNSMLFFALHLSWTLIKKNSNERFYRIVIWILPISLNVPLSKPL